MNSEWSLDELYSGYDDPRFAADLDGLKAANQEINTFVTTLDTRTPAENLHRYLILLEKKTQFYSDMTTYAGLRQRANTADAESANWLGTLRGIATATTKAETRMAAYIGSLKDLDAVIESDAYLKEFSFRLHEIAAQQKHRLSEQTEEALARYDISGASAWAELQAYLTSRLKAEYRGEVVTLSAVRNLSHNPDAAVRADAYHAEMKAYEAIKDPIAFSLNNIKQQVISTAILRGYESPLEMTLADYRISRKTLDALIGALHDNLGLMQSYLKTKAAKLGHKNGLPWYDLYAPIGDSSSLHFTAEEARDYLVSTFAKSDKTLSDMIAYAFDKEWIDFYPREGKVGGAFCTPIRGHGVSRVLSNFDGSFSAVDTLAHELGHAFHNHNLRDRSILNFNYTMPVAETASTFNENVLLSSAVADAAEPQAKLALLENQLREVTTITLDIYSRYLFETEVFEQKKHRFLFADDLGEIMLSCQKQAYGDSLDPATLQPMAWIAKVHYYNAARNFYNFPYAFGGLFARGLYLRYLEEGSSFVEKYCRMLHATSVSSCEDAAAICGVDITDKAFWEMSIRSYEKELEMYKALLG